MNATKIPRPDFLIMEDGRGFFWFLSQIFKGVVWLICLLIAAQLYLAVLALTAIFAAMYWLWERIDGEE